MPILKEKLQIKYTPTERSIQDPSVLTRNIHGDDYIPLDMSEVTIADKKTPISLQNILQNLSYKKVLIEGGPGAGKSTTLKKILELYSIGDLEQFEYVFRIKLDLLLNSEWKDNYEGKNLRVNPLACLVHASLEQVIKSRGGLDENFITLDEIIDLFKETDQSGTLLVADGYDQIAHLMGDKSIKNFINQILEFDNVIMSARPNTMVPIIKNSFDNNIIIIEGLSGENIQKFIKKYFIIKSNLLKREMESFLRDGRYDQKNIGNLLNSLDISTDPNSYEASLILERIIKDHPLTDIENLSKVIDEYYKSRIDTILDLARRNHDIQNLLSNPMHASMICMQDEISETLTLAELYRGVINRLGEKLIPTGRSIIGEPIDTLKELKILKKLAYKELTNGKLSWTDINAELEQSSDIDPLLNIGILETITSSSKKSTYKSTRDLNRPSEIMSERNFKFIDRSILEYLAACAFKDRLMLEKGSILAKEAANFIASHRHETKYLTFLKFIAGIIGTLESKNAIPIALIRFWEAMTCTIHETVETGIDKPVILWMHLLSQVMINGNPDPRIPNLDIIVEIIDNMIIKNFSRFKKEIESSEYLSIKIQEFLENLITQISTNKVEIDQATDLKMEFSDTSAIILRMDSSEEKSRSDDGEYKTSDSHEHHMLLPPEQTIAKAAIETYGCFYNLIDNNKMFDLLFSSLSNSEDIIIIKSLIISMTKTIRNHKISEDRIASFQEKILSYETSDYLLSTITKALKVARSEGQELKTILQRSETISDAPNELTLSSGAQSPSKQRPPLEHTDTKLDTTLRSSLDTLSKQLRNSKSQDEYLDLIKILTNNLLTNPNWMNEPWGKKMTAILEILGHSTDESTSFIPQLKSLTQTARKALYEHIKLMNDHDNVTWICYNYDYLEGLAKNDFSYAMEAIIYQIFSDNRITESERELICLCINRLQLSITIKPSQIINDEIQYTIVHNGREYILHGFDNAKQIEQIIETALENKAELPALENTGSGIRIAASDLPSYSMVDGSELSEEEALITWCYRTSHLLSEPTEVFLLLESRSSYFGEYAAKKISVTDEGKFRISPDYYKHPDDVGGAFRVSIFGAMLYTDTHKIRYRTESLRIDKKAVSNILTQAKNYILESKETPTDSISLLSKPPKKTKEKNKEDKPSPEGPLPIADKISILHKLVKNIEMTITGDWRTDLSTDSDNPCTLKEHKKDIIDSIDAQHTDSFRIQLDEHSAAIENFEKFKKKIDLDVLTKVISSQEAKEHARAEMIAIEADLYKYTVYKEIVLKINAFYIAVNAIYSEMVKNDHHGAAGKIGTLLGKLGPHVLLLGPVVEFIGELFNEADDMIAEERIENFINFALNSEQMAEISDKIARKMIRYNLMEITPSIRSVFAEVTEVASNLVNKGPARIIVQACKAFKDHLDEQKLNDEERAEDEIETRAKNYAEIISKAIIESIFTKSYDPKIKIGKIIESTTTNVAKVCRKDNEFKASAIIKLMVNKYHLELNADQAHTEQRDSTNAVSADNDSSAQDHTSGGNNLELAGNNPPPPPNSIGCSGGKHSCTIMAMTGSTFDNPQIEEAINQESTEEIISALQKINTISKETDSDTIINLYADAQRLYGKDAMYQLYNFLTENKEEAEVILSLSSIIGNESLLKTMFGTSNEESIKEFETIVAAEYEEGNIGGISQYIYNARFGEGYLLESARGLIKYITDLYSKFQKMLYEQDYRDVLFASNDQLQLLLFYSESGQFSIPLGRPHRGEPGDDGDYSGGKSGGLFFEGNNNDGSEESSFIDITPLYSSSLNETKLRKLLIEIKDPEGQDYSS